MLTLIDRGEYLESEHEVPEPHAFTARVRIDHEDHSLLFEEHEHAHNAAHRINTCGRRSSTLSSMPPCRCK